ncbi:MAG: NAD(+)/NADH kinase [Clostridiales bacterium]|nr:NAD(+)/NADH kinase [Clostridiales bacterium]
MKFGIYSNLTRDYQGKSCIALANILKEKNLPFFFSQDLSKIGYNADFLPNDELAKECDVIVIFGGDGTVLHYAKICARYNTPIFAINIGRVGFLTETENTDLENSIERIIKGDYKIEKRSLINVCVDNKCYDALNECVISRDSKFALIDFEYKINDFAAEKLRSDALIIATPTGSTAYSLSCGGAIVSPEVECILITPVNAYTLNSRPLIVSDNSQIEVKIKGQCNAYLNIDGEDGFKINHKDSVIITKSKLVANFIKFDEGSFYKKLRKKVNISE